jgi:predicted metal-dependent hydrolase
LSSASTRWGSARTDGHIRLNWRLIHLPISQIDYVVVHELAHLREMNHSPAFWAVVRTALPGYEQARGALRHEVLPLLDG